MIMLVMIQVVMLLMIQQHGSLVEVVPKSLLKAVIMVVVDDQ